MPFEMRCPGSRALMESHGIGKRDLEEVVVASGQPFEDIYQRISLFGRKINHSPLVGTSHDDRFKGPNRPERNQRGEVLVLKHHSFSQCALQREVFAKQAGMTRGLILPLSKLLLGRFVGNTCTGPDLAMRMG